MARKFTVDLSLLDEVIGPLARFDTDAGELCGEVDQTVNRLHVSWSGEGAQAQRAAHERWTAGAAEMRTALEDLHQVAGTAHGNYSRSVAANEGMWAG